MSMKNVIKLEHNYSNANQVIFRVNWQQNRFGRQRLRFKPQKGLRV